MLMTAARVEPGVDGCGTFLYRTGPRVGDEKVPLEVLELWPFQNGGLAPQTN